MTQEKIILCQAQLPQNDSHFQISINPDSSISEFKQKIADHIHIGANQFYLISGKKKLLDENSVRSYDIGPSQRVYIVHNLQGG
jgi:hypothetical protein